VITAVEQVATPCAASPSPEIPDTRSSLSPIRQHQPPRSPGASNPRWLRSRMAGRPGKAARSPRRLYASAASSVQPPVAVKIRPWHAGSVSICRRQRSERASYSRRVQQPCRPRTPPANCYPGSDLPQRPRATSPPRVRIEGVRGSNPLSSTKFQQVSGPPGFDLGSLGSQVGSQVVASCGGAARLRRRRHLLRSPWRLPRPRSSP
jgi:hypothetical protein